MAFRDECNLGDFDVAIKNTISLINTGKSADGMSLKYNVNDVNDKVTKGRLSEIVMGLNYLRKIFAEMKNRGYAAECKCGETSEKLRVCMDEVYLYHNAKLSR